MGQGDRRIQDHHRQFRILVSHKRLAPARTARPLTLDNRQWSYDDKRLLIQAGLQKMWQTDSRGNSWKSGQNFQQGLFRYSFYDPPISLFPHHGILAGEAPDLSLPDEREGIRKSNRLVT